MIRASWLVGCPIWETTDQYCFYGPLASHRSDLSGRGNPVRIFFISCCLRKEKGSLCSTMIIIYFKICCLMDDERSIRAILEFSTGT